MKKILHSLKVKTAFVLPIFMIVFYSNSFSQPQYYTSNSGSLTNAFPFIVPTGKAVNSLILAGEINHPAPVPSGMQITSVYFRVALGGTGTFDNLLILMAQNTISTLTSGQFYSGPWDTVYYQDTTTLSTITNGWMAIALNTPYPYDPSKSLILFVGQCGITGNGSLTYNFLSSGGIRRTWSDNGCPFTPYNDGDPSLPDFGIDVVVVGTSNNQSNVPNVYDLSQNFPNPFNPVTRILYTIPKAGNVRLVVYDVLGSEITTLVNEVSTTGTHVVNFDASGLSSGVYFYRIDTGEFTSTKKMVLMK